MADSAVLVDDEKQLAGWLVDPQNSGKVVQTRLKASDKVIARVTDGIYRQPSSALRELISNAWDADAQNVTILTDAPRFSRIYIRDDGRGMSHEALARLFHNIGGSAKRQDVGGEIGITDKSDSDRSPGGRLLIGKIGIGLFSISQLARRFQVITKVAGADFRLIAEIRMRAYTEDGADNEERDDDDLYVSGTVLITREQTEDLDAHGTDIILDDVKPRVRDLLRSADRWRELDEIDDALANGYVDTAPTTSVEKPKYHSGWIKELHVNSDEPAVLSREAELPWRLEDPSDLRMSKLVDAVENLSSQRDRPDLATALDAYLEMLWTLGLSAPVEYVDTHPFDLRQDGQFRLFWLSNDPKGKSREIPFSKGRTVRETVAAADEPRSLIDGKDPVGGFKVVIDGVELRRPVRFKYRSSDRGGLEQAMLFVGKFEPSLDKVKAYDRGGRIGFEAYLFWTGKVIPKENNGVLVRIRGASGALFDRNFFNYQVSEQTRLRQITSEIFIQSGMDAALNIDRESFNFAHPHVQLATLWLHSALRQLTNRHKDETAKIREKKNEQKSGAQRLAVVTRAEEIWEGRRGSEAAPEVFFAKNDEEAVAARREGYVAFLRAELPAVAQVSGKDQKTREAQVDALTKVLSAYGLLTDLTYQDQQKLVAAILEIFAGAES